MHEAATLWAYDYWHGCEGNPDPALRFYGWIDSARARCGRRLTEQTSLPRSGDGRSCCGACHR
ncbi:hypothetical protein [Streptomyces sp. NPDC101455]|uniref:hypothetical protein n=1 Tax=Streptomyces sp. NPDC101455 TaxID=3366142 RepID=UPI003828909C